MRSYTKKIIFYILILFIASCGHTHTHINHTQNTIRNAKRSFVKVEVDVWGHMCQTLGSGIEECTKSKIGGAWGSGSIIIYKGKKAILTVAHVCRHMKLDTMATLLGDDISYEYAVSIEGNEWERYAVEPAKIDDQNDICIMYSTQQTLDGPPLRMANKKPTYGQEIFTIASPGGLAENGMVPIFEGRFIGELENRAFYSVPTMGGSSGAPLLNRDGHLVGVTHSVYAFFHHVSVSSTFEDLWKFITI